MELEINNASHKIAFFSTYCVAYEKKRNLRDFLNFLSAFAEAEFRSGGEMKPFGDVLVGLAVIAVIFSIIGSCGTDLWLASTQWVLIAAVLSIWAVYVKIRE